MALGRKPIEIVNDDKHQLLVKAKHWDRIYLSEIAKVQNGYAFSSSKFVKTGGMPLIRIRDIDKGKTVDRYEGEYSKEYLVKKGDILVGMDGDFKVAIWQGEDALLNQRVCRIIPNSKNYDPKFLFILLQPYLNAINEETSSVTVKHLSSKTIEEIPLPYPPLPVQQAIVSKIEELFSELDNGIAQLKTAQQQLKTYRQSVLKWAFEGKLTEEWRLVGMAGFEPTTSKNKKSRKSINPTNHGLDNKLNAEREGFAPPDLPEGWKLVKTIDVIDIINNGYTPKSNFLSEGNGEIPFIKVYNLNFNGTINFKKNPTFIPEEIHTKELKRSICKPGDVLINIVGPPLGKVSIVPNEYPEWNINQAIVMFRPNERVISKFISYYMQNAFTINWLENTSKATAGQWNVKVSTCREIPLPLPSLEEQHQIVQEIESRLDIADKLEESISASLQQAEALRQSVLKKAFEGKLI